MSMKPHCIFPMGAPPPYRRDEMIQQSQGQTLFGLAKRGGGKPTMRQPGQMGVSGVAEEYLHNQNMNHYRRVQDPLAPTHAELGGQGINEAFGKQFRQMVIDAPERCEDSGHP